MLSKCWPFDLCSKRCLPRDGGSSNVFKHLVVLMHTQRAVITNEIIRGISQIISKFIVSSLFSRKLNNINSNL